MTQIDPVLPDDHPKLSRLTGVLLVNLGTPEATDYWSMRRYLKEFLTDRRVIEMSPWIWRPILELFILTTRPSRKGKDYDRIWNRDNNEGPLKTVTRAQTAKLDALKGKDKYGSETDQLAFDWAMRYGEPSISAAVRRFCERGCDRLLVVPLYPQYAAATTATVCDKVFETLMQLRWQPALRVAPPWYDDPAYIDALARSVEQGLAKLEFEPEVILTSFHGMPKASLLRGDPYYCQCAKTCRLLREKLRLSPERLQLVFQSRFGSGEWLQPYTDATVKDLARRGVKRICVVTPGFVADCLETVEEIGLENRAYFIEAGGEKFGRIDCLNDSPLGMKVLETVVQRELRGWISDD